ADLDWDWLADVEVLGLTAGASAPEILVSETIAALRGRFDVTIEEVSITEEDTVFKLPRILKAPSAA
ncbi:MAG: 4-hydroxy-3-methylbut-2-enyl diphosphate reductase, partial [Pseudomonadota bacterium]